MTTPDHLLHFTPGAEGYGTWRLECLPSDEPEAHGSYLDKSWPDEFTCRCVDPECQCREGDHEGCGEFGTFIENIGMECRAEFDPARCWTTDWWDEVGPQALFGDDWPEDVLPLTVTCIFDGDGLAVRYCPPKSLIESLEGR